MRFVDASPRSPLPLQPTLRQVVLPEKPNGIYPRFIYSISVSKQKRLYNRLAIGRAYSVVDALVDVLTTRNLNVLESPRTDIFPFPVNQPGWFIRAEARFQEVNNRFRYTQLDQGGINRPNCIPG